MPHFAVVILTATPAGLGSEGVGAYVKIDGRETLLRCAELFLNRSAVSQIQLVFAADQFEESKRKYGPHLSFTGVKVLSGGAKWMDQWNAAAQTLAADVTHVIVHDAARPAVAFSDIDLLLETAEKHEIVTLIAPCRTQLIELDDADQPLALHRRSQYAQRVFPMALSRAAFLEAASSKAEPHVSKWHLLKGSPLNLRVANVGDVPRVKAALAALPKPKSNAPLTPFDEAQW